MKTYKNLTNEEKERAVQMHFNEVLLEMIKLPAFFNYNDGLYAKLQRAFEKADDMQTPWFVNEFIMDTCKDDIQHIAELRASDCYYLENGETSMSGVCKY